ncbi:E3 ubiquitin-protein ligase [Salix suchowensis]|nr:E3 ubiquitin-protein ligase [Salix suchowensis]
MLWLNCSELGTFSLELGGMDSVREILVSADGKTLSLCLRFSKWKMKVAQEDRGSVAKRSEDIVKEHDLDGLNCAICMEPWRSEGDHQVSCLPCGHLYGFSCISKWLQRPVPTTNCPQCNAKCKFKDIRKLYTTPVVVVDEGLQKKVESLQDEIGSLKTEKSDLLDLRDNLLEIQDNLLKLLHNLKEV